MVEEEFTKVGRTSRGEKQRQVGIWVLQATAMPSVLVETGYITNKAEEEYLNSQEGQNQIATGISNALGNYINWIEKQQAGVEAQTLRNIPKSRNATPFLEAVDNHERTRMSR